jgi:myxalamid-type polyketide synthase MxaE and MxaD
MVEQGARHLVLLGRHSVPESAVEVIEALRAGGADVRMMRGDVSQERELAAVLDEIRSELPPLRGVFHSAVILDDGTLLQQTQERFLSVRAPKVAGAWNLHRLTLNDPLDYFVLFSSAASLIGSPGQGNYAAASAFMDQLAHYRRQQGYPAICINWGRWGEVGQAMKEKRGTRLDKRGFASMKPLEGLAILGELLRHSPPQIGVMSFQLPLWSQFYPNLTRSSLFAHLLAEAELQKAEQAREQHLTRAALVELDHDQREQILEQYLNDQIARVLGHTSLKLERQQQLNRLGIDSLMSVELKNRLGSDLSIAIPVTAFMQGITLEQLMKQISEQI